jgi:hypothetical protein
MEKSIIWLLPILKGFIIPIYKCDLDNLAYKKNAKNDLKFNFFFQI